MSDFMIQRSFTGETAIKDALAFMAAVDVIGGQIEDTIGSDVWNFGSLPIRLADATEIQSITNQGVMVGGKRLRPGVDSTIEVAAILDGANVVYEDDSRGPGWEEGPAPDADHLTTEGGTDEFLSTDPPGHRITLEDAEGI